MSVSELEAHGEHYAEDITIVEFSIMMPDSPIYMNVAKTIVKFRSDFMNN